MQLVHIHTQRLGLSQSQWLTVWIMRHTKASQELGPMEPSPQPTLFPVQVSRLQIWSAQVTDLPILSMCALILNSCFIEFKSFKLNSCVVFTKTIPK